MIRLIYAKSKNNIIGKDGGIPWYLPPDLKHFKELTTGHIVIMGRKTYDSLPLRFRPLKDRENVVITNNRELIIPFVDIQYSLTDAISRYINSKKDIFIIGGSTLYNEGIEYADRIDMTSLNINVEGDTYGPYIDYKEWIIKDATMHQFENIEYSFTTIVRR
jgi:dihydrofolate reductase